MSSKRSVNVALGEYSSSEEESDVDYEVMTRGRSGKKEAAISCGGKNGGRGGVGSRGSSKRPCLNRNALLARENRRRKKEYLEKIESQLSYLKRENKSLSSTIQRQDIDLKRLKAEVLYLRNVLNNASNITNILRSINESLSRGRARLGSKEWSAKGIGGKRCAATGGPRERLSAGDSDHTYTTSSRDGSEDMCSLETEQKHRYLLDNDSFILNNKLDLEPDRLPLLDENIFDSIGDFDENPSNDLEHDIPTKLFDDLDDNGICLHLNSSKISLEFCSVCRLNSLNSIEAAEPCGNQAAQGIACESLYDSTARNSVDQLSTIILDHR